MITAETILNDLQGFTYKEVLKFKPEKVAFDCSVALIECLYLNFKNQLMYIPTSSKLSIRKRYDLIYNEFTGNNHKDLAIKYKLSLPTIYKIVNTKLNKYIRDVQVDLFPFDNDVDIDPVTIMVTNQYLPFELLKCGLLISEANDVSKKISDYLIDNYPGIAICISKKIVNKKIQKSQLSLL